MTTDVDSTLVFFLCPFILALVWVLQRNLTRLSAFPLPPGPRPIPLIGNALNMPKDMQWLTYSKWASIYGDVMHVNVFRTPIIIVSSAEAAHEFFEKRSSNNSDRLFTPMMELTGVGWNFGLLPYGESWRQHRRKFHQFFNERVVKRYLPLQSLQTLRLLRLIHAHPEKFFRITNEFFGRSILQVVYGFQDDQTLDYFNDMVANTAAAFVEIVIPGKHWVDFIPWLRYMPSWIPGMGFKRKAAHFRSVTLAAVEEPFKAAHLNSNTTKPDSMHSILPDALESVHTDETVLRDTAALAFLAGADTTSSTMLSFILAMTLNPEVQRFAQHELDSVVGPDRLPQFSDKDSLPYINALIKECLRWQPVTPLGVPHRSIADDVFQGKYFIPKKSLIIGNTWAISRDANMYPFPEDFNPGRFLKDGKINPDVLDPVLFSFGFGRRICPGRFFALNSLFMAITSILHVYNISPPLDENGQPMLPKVEMTSGFLSFPVEYKCIIKPRSEAAEQLVIG